MSWPRLRNLLLGLTGSEADIAAVVEAYRASYRKLPGDEADA